MKQIIYTKDAPEPVGPYSQAVLAGNTLYCSGQIAIDPATGQLIQGDIAAQTHLCMKNIQNVLKAAKMGLNNVVKVSCFLKEMSDFAEFNGVYAQYFTDSKPARSCVAVKELPKGALVEIEVIALREDG